MRPPALFCRGLSSVTLEKKGRVRDTFTIHIFYADGSAPESGERRLSDLSPKWLAICGDLLTHHGPVMRHNMGGTLSQFDVVMAGPAVELLAFGKTSFRLAISLGTASKQDDATVSQFRELWTRLVESTGNTVAAAAMRVFDRAATEPCVLVVDTCQPVDDDDKLALYQLGEHLIGAYIKYCAASAPG
jgi:hypothetical protein